jgi:hypothetical protein
MIVFPLIALLEASAGIWVPNGSDAIASLCGGALTFGSLEIVLVPSAFCVPERHPARDPAFRECSPERRRTRVAQVRRTRTLRREH